MLSLRSDEVVNIFFLNTTEVRLVYIHQHHNEHLDRMCDCRLYNAEETTCTSTSLLQILGLRNVCGSIPINYWRERRVRFLSPVVVVVVSDVAAAV